MLNLAKQQFVEMIHTVILTDVGDAVVAKTMGGGELVFPPQGEDEGIGLVRP